MLIFVIGGVVSVESASAEAEAEAGALVVNDEIKEPKSKMFF
jgi:heptaprenylglyceryl phosphate synthase